MGDKPPLTPIQQAIEKALRNDSPENFDAINQGRFEEEVVKFLLRRFDIQAWKPDLLNLCLAEQGVRRLRLNYFERIFDDFPIVLAVKHIRKLAGKVNTRLLFSNFENLPFVAAWDAHYANVAAEAKTNRKAVGIVIKWPYLQGGLVVHNAELQQDRGGTRLQWVLERPSSTRDNPKVKRRLVVEDMTTFCNSIRYWNPNPET